MPSLSRKNLSATLI